MSAGVQKGIGDVDQIFPPMIIPGTEDAWEAWGGKVHGPPADVSYDGAKKMVNDWAQYYALAPNNGYANTDYVGAPHGAMRLVDTIIDPVEHPWGVIDENFNLLIFQRGVQPYIFKGVTDSLRVIALQFSYTLSPYIVGPVTKQQLGLAEIYAHGQPCIFYMDWIITEAVTGGLTLTHLWCPERRVSGELPTYRIKSKLVCGIYGTSFLEVDGTATHRLEQNVFRFPGAALDTWGYPNAYSF